MPAYAAFLRAINIGGRRVSGAELARAFEGLGLTEVSNFRASGNVVFSAGREPVGKLTERIETGLEVALGYEVVTFLRSGKELAAMAAARPFPQKLVDASHGKLQVSVLGKKPSAAAQKKVLAMATDQDRLAFGPRELYWLPSGGTMDSSLDLKAIDELVGPNTRRTQGTIETLYAKYFGG
jgi:uncharacterized protein (DUF1697 family)